MNILGLDEKAMKRLDFWNVIKYKKIIKFNNDNFIEMLKQKDREIADLKMEIEEVEGVCDTLGTDLKLVKKKLEELEAKPKEIPHEVKVRREKMQKDFDNLMSYDYKKAVSGK
jgi:chromosome segregation ATPase